MLLESQCLALAHAFESSGDLDEDGRISYEEFEHYMQNEEVCVRFIAVLGEILADSSEGMMVNYYYDLGEVERNKEMFADGEVVASEGVRKLHISQSLTIIMNPKLSSIYN